MTPRRALAALAILAWIATSLMTRGTSIHLPLAVVSVVLLAVAFAIDGAHLRLMLVVRPRDVLIGIAGGLVMAVVTRIAYQAALSLIPALGPPVAVLYGTMRESPPLAVTMPLLVVVIACEEVVWRGVLTHDRRTALLSTLGYTVAQLGATSLLLAPIALVCGIVWSAERLATRGLIAPFLTHLVWNVITLVYFPLDAPLRF